MSNFSMTSIPGLTTSPSFTPSSTMASEVFSDTLASISLTPTSFNPSSISTPSSFVSTSATPAPSSSSIPPSSSSVFSSSSIIPSSTTTVIGSTTAISTVTQVFTSVQTFSPSAANTAPSTSVVLITRTSGVASTVETQPSTTRNSAAAASSSEAASLQGNSSDNGSGGLGKTGTVAVAVVVPIVVVALLVIAGIFLWRRRKQNKSAREQRRQEVEEYGYNPNDDPTLPAVGGAASDSPEMSEEAGYRGWGTTTNAAMSSARKPSTNLSSNGIGMAVSDNGARGTSPGSPGTHPSDGARSSDPLMGGTDGAGGIGASAAAGAGGAYAANRAIHGAGGVQRGPSNASSTYSAGDHTDDGDVMGGAQDMTYDSNYSQYTAYNPNAGGFGDNTGQPIIKDVSARRNTKIENAVYPQPGNSGIAQNF